MAWQRKGNRGAHRRNARGESGIDEVQNAERGNRNRNDSASQGQEGIAPGGTPGSRFASAEQEDCPAQAEVFEGIDQPARQVSKCGALSPTVPRRVKDQ